MAVTHTDQRTTESPVEFPDNSEAIVEEVVEACLHPDRAHHDELGRTDAPAMMQVEHPEPSPREQPAAPIDIAKTGE